MVYARFDFAVTHPMTPLVTRVIGSFEPSPLNTLFWIEFQWDGSNKNPCTKYSDKKKKESTFHNGTLNH
jgi:hypothetical protein